MHWVPFKIGDYLKDTRGLSLEEHGAYLLMLTENWQGRSIPSDPIELFRITGAFSDSEQNAVLKILSKFFEKKSDGFWQKNAKKIHQKQAKIYDDRVKNGSTGGRPAKPHGSEKQNHMGGKTRIKTRSSSNEEETPIPPEGGLFDLSTGFDSFWQTYPQHRRKEKAVCLDWWKKNKLHLLADSIIDAVKRYACSEEWLKDGGQFVPYPSRFLKKKRWEDEIKTTPKTLSAPYYREIP